MKQTLAYRGLKAAVIILGVLIVAALAILVAGFALKLGKHPAREAAIAFVPPAGAHLVSAEAAGDRLVLRLHSSTGDEVDVIDTADGHVVARYKFAP